MRSAGEDNFLRRVEAGLRGETLDSQEVARPCAAGSHPVRELDLSAWSRN